MALGLRHRGNPARVFNLLSDGELDEGSTWEAAMACAHHGLDNVTAIVDVNALQADGPTVGVLRTEPVPRSGQAFGGTRLRVDGNDLRRAAWPRSTQPRRRTAVPVGADLRHPHRPRRAAARVPREGPLHARRRHEWQIARTQLTAGKDCRPMTTTTPRQADHLGHDRLVRRPRPAHHPAPFGHALAQLAEQRPEIVGLSADLAKYTDMHIFRDAHPERFFQMGMAEQP